MLWSCCCRRVKLLCRCSVLGLAWSNTKVDCRTEDGGHQRTQQGLINMQPSLAHSALWWIVCVLTVQGGRGSASCRSSRALILLVQPDRRLPSPDTDQYQAQTWTDTHSVSITGPPPHHHHHYDLCVRLTGPHGTGCRSPE